MVIGVLKEPSFETRVSLLPDAVALLVKKGHQVMVEYDAGQAAFAPNEQYQQAGAIMGDRNKVVASDIILSIHLPEVKNLPGTKGVVLIGVYQPLYRFLECKELASVGYTCFSLDMLPRTTRAQSMDVLSSQANIAGYKAVLLAANTYSRYFPMFMTAAGSIAPAKVLILGAGVAGLQAIATARRLGAVVEVFDTRPAVKEEVMSLGAKFIEVEGAADASGAGGYAVEQSAEFKARQQQKIADSIAKADIVVTTAQIPGKQAPKLVTREMVESMRKGALIIDLAAATGGNTELTRNNETVNHNGVTIIGDSNLPATMPSDASKLYGKNLMNFMELLTSRDGKLELNWEDDLVKGSCICFNGEVVHERVKSLLG
ncbi:Re/Si-specific NAD(P)(+) transhydrogenase subunit alpha [Flavihumibacter rivuli]|uniref:Re/Si-specific NAD(P)(+) transhydrogenase subunit alpha n=1 Tax=Flavihumibacter rivuli TaxID=2838156 RepID=UPI001BDDDCB0|nr:Re/Si-specific NAD(P)(+) transhydrogenase subunit alpha [Flavihumibacter rivuli]ULQ56858.1 Re/Si-specific NAD(P)(+) transhydrogenase subunit alpha [Flavihumibacter rivuli]